MDKKERVDVLLVEKGLFLTREKAKSAIMAGLVFLEAERIEKSGMKIPASANLVVKGAIHPYVGRGGLKLEKALHAFSLDLHGKVMMDIGASTGGFTDCALQNGVKMVYAIDVGYNQLDWKLRSDPRVVVMERTNFRYMESGQLQGEDPDFATMDVSFISIKLLLPAVKLLLREGGEFVCLIKPQFEAGREKVGKSGVVRDAAVHRDVLTDVLASCAHHGFQLQGLTYSPITGGEGNIEFLAYFILQQSNQMLDEAIDEQIAKIVLEAALHFP